MANAVCTYDFTIPRDSITKESLIKKLNKIAKEWCFQLEKGETSGYEHYQGRLSLKVKTRQCNLISKWGLKETHWSITSNNNRKNNFYVLKDETRIDGPFESKDYEEFYVPRQIREIPSLYPWQQEIIEMSTEWDTRTIHIIVNEKGNIGKSILKGYMRCNRLGQVVPFCNNYKDIMRMIFCMKTSNCYLIDMPRAINKENLGSLFSGIESIKDGYCFDDRYEFKQKYFDCPNIFVFTNTVPDMTMLSEDRWKLHMVVDNELVPFEEECILLGES